jgi:hypothetical protein
MDSLQEALEGDGEEIELTEYEEAVLESLEAIQEDCKRTADNTERMAVALESLSQAISDAFSE